jgi:hypothetical protein
MRRPPRRLWIASCLIALIALASCGGGGNSGSTAASTSTATTQTSTGKSSTATTSSTPTRCAPGGLRISAGRGSIATGHVESPFLIRNTSGGRCTLRGFPSITALGSTGQALAVKVKPVAVDFFAPIPNREVALPAGRSASFRLVTTNGGQSVSGCPRARQVRVALPHDPATQTLPFVAIVCPGTVTVSRIAAGRSAYQGG